MICDIKNDDCVKYLEEYQGIDFDLTFLDPPFNQSKDYRSHDDNMTPRKYWDWMSEVCNIVFQKSSQGAAIYFMQREKNEQYVLDALATSRWTF